MFCGYPTGSPSAVPVPAPTPVPTLNPTRVPIVSATISIDGITCADDFDEDILDTALDTIMSGADFTDATCVDSSSGIDATVTAAASYSLWGATYDSLYAYVVGTCAAAVDDGSFDTAIADAESSRRRLSRRDLGRRLAMSDGTVASVSVSTFSPTAAPTPAPTPMPTPAPTPRPGSPSATPVPAPTAPPKKKSED